MRICCLCLLLLLLLPAAGAQESAVEITAVACPERFLADASAMEARISCGRALMPENRQAPDNGRRVNLFFLRIPPVTEDGECAHPPFVRWTRRPSFGRFEFLAEIVFASRIRNLTGRSAGNGSFHSIP